MAAWTSYPACMTHYSLVTSLKFITKSLRSGGKKRRAIGYFLLATRRFKTLTVLANLHFNA
ncbi:hypothetical protein B6G11_07115 [Salmonella enterica]|uniref:Uncharacterized protein n=5 Tax=Salmonella enterica TaxID=28901 RepID=A0A5U2PAW4_SALER|nr:hypothetical protein [Salmonella enterica]ECH1170722.1 hypothetical protein [Salmonella enterica subsp. enterica serovar Aqua]ECK0453346.1 hypothetical protein [Salmonella enterica subsp. enterica serovar Richmond]EDG9406923.1 hypothetical protein [Salmonella enterica subsp. enterica serovar Tennessee]EDI0783696.1 hypothetical protein [Salmonella enterica subsp. enterica serovar Kasenyi]ELL3452405.1 hypothetical protein [Salmonella enterica subsp. enterica serovar Allandale]